MRGVRQELGFSACRFDGDIPGCGQRRIGLVQIFLGPLPGCDVLHRALVVQELSCGRIPDGAGILANPDLPAVLAIHLTVEVVDFVVPIEQLFEAVALLRIDIELVLNVGSTGQEFVDGVETVHLGQREIGVEIPSIRRGLEDAVDGVLNQAAVIGLGAFELFARCLQFRDVPGKSKGAHDLSVRRPQWHLAGQCPTDPAIREALLLQTA